VTRVFEDLDLPGLGQPFRAVVDLQLVDAATKAEVKEAYWNGRTIVGSLRANVDGSPAQWNRGLARAQWTHDLAPNDAIVYQGSPGGTLWRRTVQSQSATRRNKIKKSKAYIEVPDSLDTLLFGDLIVPIDAPEMVVDHVWTIDQGTDWYRTMAIDAEEGEDISDYVFELELRRRPGASVVTEVDFDYTDLVSEGRVGMHLPNEVTSTMIGTYVGKLQRYHDERKDTLANWAFVITRDT
jgi:hypothetical protein